MCCFPCRSAATIIASLAAAILLTGAAFLGVAARADDGGKAPPADEKVKQKDADRDAGKEKDKKKDGAKESGKDKDKSKDHAAKVGDPWPLAVCALAGEKLGDDAVTVVHEGRELRFCCAKCVEKFKADPAAVIAKADKRIIEDQAKFYPVTTCLIMPDEELVAGDIEEVVYNNRLFRFCCKKCVRKFKEDPEKYWGKLDAAVIAAQKPTYTATTCPVSGEKLGSHGDPVNMVVANRLVRLCCKGCRSEVQKNSAAVLAKVGSK